MSLSSFTPKKVLSTLCKIPYILLCFFYSNTKTFEATLGLFCWTLSFHRRRHRRKLWWDLASLYQNGKDTEGDWMKVDGEHFKNLGLFHTGLHSDQSSFIKLLIFNIFRCFSKKGLGASTMWDSKADLLQNECENPCRQISWPLCRLALCGLSLSPWMKATNPCIKLNQKHCCSQQRTHWVKHVFFQVRCEVLPRLTHKVSSYRPRPVPLETSWSPLRPEWTALRTKRFKDVQRISKAESHVKTIVPSLLVVPSTVLPAAHQQKASKSHVTKSQKVSGFKGW